MNSPSHWSEARLGEVVSFERSIIDPRDASDQRYVGLEHVASDGTILAGAPEATSLASSKFKFGSRHILYGKLRPYLRKVARPNFEGICSTDILPLLPSAKVDRDYLFHALRDDQFVSLATARSAGINLPRISPRLLAEFPIPLPPMAAQKRIAAILDKADAIRAKRRDALRQADALLRSAFDHMVGFRAAGYDCWQQRSIESLAADRPHALRTGPFGSDLRHSEFTDAGVVVLGIDNAVQNRFAWGERRFISSEKYRKLERYRVFPGDVIVTIMGTTGRSAVVPDDIPLAISTKHLATITLDRDQADPHFISFAIHSDSRLRRQIEAANKGAIMDGLNLTIIRNLKLHLPPLPLQQRFGDLVRWHGTRVEQAQDPAQNGDALYASLAQRAFRGEL